MKMKRNFDDARQLTPNTTRREMRKCIRTSSREGYIDARRVLCESDALNGLGTSDRARRGRAVLAATR